MSDGQEQISVDSVYQGDDAASDYGDSLLTDSTSITSSIVDYVYENGRRYHRFGGEGKYALPNDETEQDRLDLHNHTFLLLLGDLFLAPLPANPQRVLDVGTGTGIWALQVAETYPSAEVVGIDLSPIQPSWVYPNCKFEVDDAELDWTFPYNSFDYIHARNLAQSIRDWPRLVQQMYKHTKPGGYVELMEVETTIRTDDDSMPKDGGLVKWIPLFIEAHEKAGLRNVLGPDEMKSWVTDAGFVDIVVHRVRQPFAPWPKNKKLKEAGAFNLLNVATGMEAYSLQLFTRHLQMSEEKAKEICRACVKDINNPKCHPYNFIYVVVGKKPENAVT